MSWWINSLVSKTCSMTLYENRNTNVSSLISPVCWPCLVESAMSDLFTHHKLHWLLFMFLHLTASIFVVCQIQAIYQWIFNPVGKVSLLWNKHSGAFLSPSSVCSCLLWVFEMPQGQNSFSLLVWKQTVFHYQGIWNSMRFGLLNGMTIPAVMCPPVRHWRLNVRFLSI